MLSISPYEGLPTSQTHFSIQSYEELYEDIFRYVNKRDLIVLCTVCRTARYEAQRLLFRHIDFTEYSNISRHLLSWSAAITKCKRLSASVRTLSLSAGIRTALSTAESRQLVELFPRAIVALKNLVELHIWTTDDSSIYLLPWVLEACRSFRLRKFDVELPCAEFPFSYSLNVFSHQPDLRETTMCLSFDGHDGDGGDSVLPTNLIPHLSIVQLRRWRTLGRLVPRPIERMYLRARDPGFADHVDRDMQACAHLFSGLKHLRFEVGLSDYVNPVNKAPERLRFIARRAPKLKTLAFFDDDVFYGYNVDDLVLALSGFKTLETFVMDPVEEFIPSSSSFKFDSRKQCLRFADLLMEACPSLHLVAFPIEPYVKRDWMEGDHHVDLEMKGDCPRFVRSVTGHARLEGFDYSEDLKVYWKSCV